MRINKVVQYTEFKNILESKVDINLKIAKILSNAINWKVDFSNAKGSKFSFTFPVQPEQALPTKGGRNSEMKQA